MKKGLFVILEKIEEKLPLESKEKRWLALEIASHAAKICKEKAVLDALNEGKASLGHQIDDRKVYEAMLKCHTIAFSNQYFADSYAALAVCEALDMDVKNPLVSVAHYTCESLANHAASISNKNPEEAYAKGKKEALKVLEKTVIEWLKHNNLVLDC